MERHEIALDHRDGDLIIEALRSMANQHEFRAAGTASTECAICGDYGDEHGDPRRADTLADYVLRCFDADHSAAVSS